MAPYIKWLIAVVYQKKSTHLHTISRGIIEVTINIIENKGIGFQEVASLWMLLLVVVPAHNIVTDVLMLLFRQRRALIIPLSFMTDGYRARVPQPLEDIKATKLSRFPASHGKK